MYGNPPGRRPGRLPGLCPPLATAGRCPASPFFSRNRAIRCNPCLLYTSIEQTEEFIERFRYKPTKSNQVQSRIKQLEKIERIEIDEEDTSALNIKFPPAPRSGQIVVEAKDAGMSFGAKHVFSGATFTIERGQKVALVGRNGEGKTTFARMAIGELTPTEGSVRIGHNVRIGYYAQNQDDLMNGDFTVFDTLDRVAVGDIRTRLRDILGAFLFRGEEIDKKVRVLSGGERARLAMARLMLEPYNLLVLDEPTNHMDMRSKDILKNAVKKYDGTVIVISHDREFLDGLVERVYELSLIHIFSFRSVSSLVVFQSFSLSFAVHAVHVQLAGDRPHPLDHAVIVVHAGELLSLIHILRLPSAVRIRNTAA